MSVTWTGSIRRSTGSDDILLWLVRYALARSITKRTYSSCRSSKVLVMSGVDHGQINHRPDTCRQFFCSAYGTGDPDRSRPDPDVDDPHRSDYNDDDDDDEDDVAFIDASHLADNSLDQYAPCRDVPESISGDSAGVRTRSTQPVGSSCRFRPDDVIVTSPAHPLEFHDSSYFYEDGAFVDTTADGGERLPPIDKSSLSAARVQNYLRQSSKSIEPTGRNHCAGESVPEETGDSGYADSSTSTDYRRPPSDADRTETGSSVGPEAGYGDGACASTPTPTSGRLLSRRQFHRGSFVRYRYPARYHRRSDDDRATRPAGSDAVRPPSCLRPTVRYGNEPLVQKRPNKTRTRRRWTEPPRYGPRSRHVEVECEIIKLVDKLDIGVQCTQAARDDACQCTPATSDVQTQCPRARSKSRRVQTMPKKYADVGVQKAVATRSRMVDTDVTVTYYPNELPTSTTMCAKCQQEVDRCNVNYWVDSNVIHP